MITAPNLDRSLIPYMWLEIYSLSQVHFSIRIFNEEIQADHALEATASQTYHKSQGYELVWRHYARKFSLNCIDVLRLLISSNCYSSCSFCFCTLYIHVITLFLFSP